LPLKDHVSEMSFNILTDFMYLHISGKKNVAITVLGKQTDFKITAIQVQSFYFFFHERGLLQSNCLDLC